MAGPRGAGRLGVAAEGGARPLIAVYFKFLHLHGAWSQAFKTALHFKFCISMVLRPQDNVLAAPAPESWDSLRSTLICVFSSASSFSA